MAGYLGGQQQDTRPEQQGESDSNWGKEIKYEKEEEDDHIGREAPSSQVGYGGGHRSAADALVDPGEGKAHGGHAVEVRPRPEDHQNTISGPGAETNAGASSAGAQERLKGKQDDASHPRSRAAYYGLCHSNSFPREAGFGVCSVGGYPLEGEGKRVPDEGKDSSRIESSGFDSDSLQENEVRGGVPHGIVSGLPSGAGQDNYGESQVSRVVLDKEGRQLLEKNPTGAEGESREYTHPGGAHTHTQQLEQLKISPTSPSTEEAHEASRVQTSNLKSGAPKEAHHHEEGLMARIRSCLAGQKQSADEKPAAHGASTTSEGAEDYHEKPSFMEKMKDRLSPRKHKQTS